MSPLPTDLLAKRWISGSPQSIRIAKGEGIADIELNNAVWDESYDVPYVAGQKYVTELRVYRILPVRRYEPGPVPGSLW